MRVANLLPTILINLLFLSNSQVLAQDTYIKEIRRVYNETQDRKDFLTRRKGSDFENSSEGAELTAYYSGRNLKLIETEYFGHMGKGIEEFYFDQDKLYFVFRKVVMYNAPRTSEQFDSDKTRIEENRYYFWNGQLVRWINPEGQHIDAETDKFQNEMTRILNVTSSTKAKFD